MPRAFAADDTAASTGRYAAQRAGRGAIRLAAEIRMGQTTTGSGCEANHTTHCPRPATRKDA